MLAAYRWAAEQGADSSLDRSSIIALNHSIAVHTHLNRAMEGRGPAYFRVPQSATFEQQSSGLRLFAPLSVIL